MCCFQRKFAAQYTEITPPLLNQAPQLIALLRRFIAAIEFAMVAQFSVNPETLATLADLGSAIIPAMIPR